MLVVFCIGLSVGEVCVVRVIRYLHDDVTSCEYGVFCPKLADCFGEVMGRIERL